MRKLLSRLTLVATMFVLTGTAHAGRVGGPGTTKSVVKPYSIDSYDVKFEKDAVATVEIVGDNSTDFDCFVYDSDDNLIDQDQNLKDSCSLLWIPKWTGYFKIKIKNLGSEENAYTLKTN